MNETAKALLDVQMRLKAPKGQFNSFGGYKYRSCEDILEAVKPLLAECGLVMTISDEIELVSGRWYVKATAKVVGDDGEISSTAYAREAESKKGQDESQITGTASSYARKYALNGLFLIDDTKDADATNRHGNEQQQGRRGQRQGGQERRKPDPLTEAKARLWRAVKAYAEARGDDPKAVIDAVGARSDANMADPAWLCAVAAEFEGAA